MRKLLLSTFVILLLVGQTLSTRMMKKHHKHKKILKQGDGEVALDAEATDVPPSDAESTD